MNVTPANHDVRTEPKEYDLVILGSGEGAKYLAWTLAKEGQRVAVVERKYIGGSCPNIACLPSKNVIHSAKVASYFRRSAEFGIEPGDFTIDMAAVRNRKREMVNGLIGMHLENFNQSGAELLIGSGRFIAPKTLEVALQDGTTCRLRGTNVVIGTGTRATLGPIPGLVDSKPLTHIQALELDVIPEHLLVMGGGYVGLEFAQAMRRFGSRVTVIERNSRLVHQEDEDVADGLRALFEDEGIELILNAQVQTVSGTSGQSVKLIFLEDGTEKSVEGTHLLVATGRTPNTDGIGLELAGVKLTDRGYVKVNERLETTAPGVWAIGEVAGSPQFTHIAFDDFRIIRDNLAGGHHVTTGRQVPFCMFTDPEFARVGISEAEAAARHFEYRLFKIPMNAVLRTRTLSETRGFLKALVERESDRILGFTVFGVNGGEIMGQVQIAMLAGLPYTALRDAVLTHPTLAEGLVVLFSSPPRLVTHCEKRTVTERPNLASLTSTRKTEIAQTFLAGLRTQDAELMRSLIALHAAWSMPGESSISGDAVGLHAILARAATIASHGMRFSVERILAGHRGVALALHNTAEHNGETFDMHLVTVLQLQEDRVVGIATYMHDVEKLNAFFKKPGAPLEALPDSGRQQETSHA